MRQSRRSSSHGGSTLVSGTRWTCASCRWRPRRACFRRIWRDCPTMPRGAPPPGLASVFDGPHVTVRIVGVEAAPYEFPPQGIVLPPLVMTPAFYQKYANGLVREGFLHVRLAPVPMLGRSRPECRGNWERTRSRPRPRRPPMSSGRFTSKPPCCGDWRCSSPSRPW